MDAFLAKLVNYYALSEEEVSSLLRKASFIDLPVPSKFKDMEKAKNRIFNAIKKGEKIGIYGDYDCDGVLSTTIITKTLRDLGYKEVYPFLPSRYIDGYGITEKYVENAYKKGISLIITVDNGVSAFDALNKAKDLGIDVILTDHHEIVSDLPPHYAVLHPLFSEYGDVVSCGAYVSFMLASSLKGSYDPYLGTLAGIATISDMMPLRSYNRTIVRLALDYLNGNANYALIKLAGTTEFTEDTIALKIAPKINALGRMGQNYELMVLLEYFSTDDKSRIDEMFVYIDKVNSARKKTMEESYKQNDDVDLSKSAIVTITNEKEGLIGLLAARYLSTYDKVSVVFCVDSSDKTLLKGSARSKDGFSIVKAFESLGDLLETYGGHAFAGGCSLKISNYEKFKEAFTHLADVYTLEEQTKKTIDLNINELTFKNYETYRNLGPYGQGFPKPYFLLREIPKKVITYSRDGKHVLTPLGRNQKLVAFYKGEEIRDLQTPSLSFIGTLETNTFRGYRTLQFVVTEVVKD